MSYKGSHLVSLDRIKVVCPRYVNVDNFKDVSILIKQTQLKLIFLTKDYPRSHELEKYLA